MKIENEVPIYSNYIPLPPNKLYHVLSEYILAAYENAFEARKIQV